MDAPDEIIHQSMRLRIVAALAASTGGELIEFSTLKSALQATDGNLGTHLGTLETAGYIRIEKDFVGKKPRTRVALTRAGRRAFDRHVAYLREILDAASGC